MDSDKFFLSYFLAFIISLLFTWLTRGFALYKSILDIPNERSSHAIPTPRGGGVAILFTFMFFIMWQTMIGKIDLNFARAMIGGGLLIALTGFWDDVYSLHPSLRILMHLIAAVWATYWLSGFPVIDFGTGMINLGWLGSILATIAIVWSINFYNFMDGIDGLAGMQGIFVGLAAAIALWWLGASNLIFVMGLLVAAIAGFTVWNWPPAKIFLGDVGSGFLGYIFAVTAIHTGNKGILPISFWLILIAVFLCDATFTLISRIFKGQRWYSAHREHAYQVLVILGASHKQVTIGISVFNVCILLPMAYAVLFKPDLSLWFLLGSIIILWLSWFMIKSLPISKRK